MTRKWKKSRTGPAARQIMSAHHKCYKARSGAACAQLALRQREEIIVGCAIVLSEKGPRLSPQERTQSQGASEPGQKKVPAGTTDFNHFPASPSQCSASRGAASGKARAANARLTFHTEHRHPRAKFHDSFGNSVSTKSPGGHVSSARSGHNFAWAFFAPMSSSPASHNTRAASALRMRSIALP